MMFFGSNRGEMDDRYKEQFCFQHARKNAVASAAIAAASVLLAARGALATTDSWIGPTTDSNWSTPANWTLAVPGTLGTFTNADVALFNTGSGTVNVDTNRNVKSINFDLGAAAFNLSGGNFLLTSGGNIQIISTFTSTTATEKIATPITLEGSYSLINNSSAGVLNFSGNISNGAAATLTLGGTNTAANNISGVISNGVGATSLTQSAGTWTLLGADTLTGATTLSGGALQLGNTLATQNSVVTISKANGLTFTSGLGSATAAGLSGASNELLTDAGSAAVVLNIGTYFNATTNTYGGILSGTGGIATFGTNAQTFSGSNNYSGTTTVNGLSTLSATGASASTTTPFGTGAMVLNGGTLNLAPSTAATAATWTAASSITTGTALSYGGGSILTLTKQDASSSIRFTIGGGGSAVLSSGSNTSTLVIKTANTDLGTGENLIINGTAPATNGPAGMVNPSIVGSGVTTASMGDFLTYNPTSGFLSGYGAYTQIAASITSTTNDSASILDIQQAVTVSANSSAGAVVVEGSRSTNTTTAGSLTIAPNTTLSVTGSNGKAAIILNGYNSVAGANGGIITSASTTTSVLNFGTNQGIIYGFGNSQVSGSAGATSNYINALIAGSGGVTLAGTSTVTLYNLNNTFTGGLTVNAGATLEQLTNPGVGYGLFQNGLWGDPNNTVTLNGGTLSGNGAANANLFGIGRSLILGSGGGIVYDGFNNYPVVAATISGTGPLLVGGVSSSGFNLTGDQGTGFVMGVTEITGNNTNTGGVILNGSGDDSGVAIVSADNNLGAPANPVTFNSGILAIYGTSFNSFGSHPVTFAPAAAVGLDILSPSNTFIISQPIINATGAFYKLGLGTLDLTARANFGDSIQVLGGTLKVDESLGGSVNAGDTIAAPLNFGGGTLYILGKASGTTQNFGAVSMFSQGKSFGTPPLAVYGGGTLVADNNGGALVVNLGTLGGTASDTSTNASVGNALNLIATDSSTAVGTTTITATTNKDATGIYGGRIVYTDSTGTNWATTATAFSPYTLAGYTAYNALATTAGTDTLNSIISSANRGNVLSGSRVTNTLKIANIATDSLALGGNKLTLAGGALLMTGIAGFSITGGTLTSGLASANSTTRMSFNGSAAEAVNPGSDLVVQQYGAAALNIGAQITNFNTSAASSLTKAGTGTLVLSTSNTYTGFTYVDGGILSITNDASIGGSNSTVNGAIGVTSSSTSGTSVTLASATLPAGFGVGSYMLGQYVTNINGTTLTLSGNAGTAISSGTANWATAQDLVLNGGTLQVTGGGNISLGEVGTGGTGTATVNRSVLVGPNGGKIDVTNGTTLTLAGSFFNYGGNVTAPTNLTIDSSDGSAGTVVVPAANWFGSYTLQGGTLRLTGALGFDVGVFSTVNFAANEANSGNTGFLQLNGNIAILAGLNSSVSTAVVEDGSNTSDLLGVNNGDNETYAGTLLNTTNSSSGTLGLLKAGGGALSLTNASSNYTGITEIDGGILNVAALANGGFNSSIGKSNNGAANICFGGGTLQYTGSGSQTTDRLFTLGDLGNVVASADGVGGNNGTIDASGAANGSDPGIIVFSNNTGTIAFAQTGVHNLTLTGSNTGANTLAPNLEDSTYNSTVFPTTLTKTGIGQWVLTGSNTYSGNTNVSGGTLTLAVPSALSPNTNVMIANGASAVANNGGTNKLTLQAQSVLTSGTGKFDLQNNDLVLHNTSIGIVTAMVASGFSSGSWIGPGIDSSVAASSNHLTALGVATNTTVDGANGSTDVVVKYTYYGDANLDGKVDGSDYSLIDSSYLLESTEPTPFLAGISGWSNGDFNYDNVVNGSDYTLIDNAFNSQGATISAEIAAPTDQIAGSVSGTGAVPEPTSLGLLALATVGLLGRRRYCQRMSRKS